MPKGKNSEVGETQPTENSKKDIDDLVSDVLGAPEDAPNLEKQEEVTEDTTDQDTAEETTQDSEESEEASEDSEEESEETSEEDEDVVPASKHQKALEKMQKRIDALTQKLKANEAKEQSQAKTQDEKLAQLSVSELNELRENAEEAIIDAKVSAKTDGTDVAARVNELKELRRAIDRTITEAPKRFQSKQISHLNEMLQEVKEIDPSVVEMKGELWETAKRVYSRMPSLHTSETGQAEALAIATEYFLERQTAKAGREQTSNLSKKVANLKRKTSLEGKTRVANSEQVSHKKIRDKAVKGDYFDKLNFVKTLVPDEFLQS